ncbi:sulfur carrier protein ThiS [Alteromonadaceae bacterium BrNp21-10]|nr:sulfur carrier protein ThiS [Alteromonadaceae bacterium BrNp21-10]
MNININGQSVAIVATSTSLSLSELLEQYNAQLPFAVAINGDFVAQSNYHNIVVSSTDMIDIVSPIFGG